MFALSASADFFLPLSREFVLQRERFGLWKVYAPSLSLFFVFLFFIVMMTYGNYLHRSMLCCTEWKCWSPGSIVPDALCKQPAGFAFSFFSLFFFSPPSLPFQGTSGISYTSVEGSFAICEQLSSFTLSCPLYCELHKYLFSLFCWRGEEDSLL